jgi:putative transposase
VRLSYKYRMYPNRIKMVVLKRDRVGNWYAVFQIELPDVAPATEPTRSVGMDMGLDHFVALSTGEMI